MKDLDFGEIRLIITREAEGSGEDVIFTSDIEHESNYFCSTGWEVVFDKIINAELPVVFPIDFTLKVDK